MAMASRTGQMEPVMRACGKITKRVARGNFGMSTAMCLRVIGSMIKQMDSGFTLIRTGLRTLANGKTIYSTERAKKVGPMGVNTTGDTGLGRSTATANTGGLTAQSTKVIGSKTELKERVSIIGWTDVALLAIGSITTCMARACTVGRTGGVMKGATWRIKSMGSGCITGLMAENMRVTGHLESSMGKAST